MQESINTLLKKSKKHTYNIKSIMKKTAMTAVAVAAITFAGSTSTSASTEKLTTVYYVYLDHQYIGTVSDKHVIENIVNQKLKESQAIYKNLHLSLDSEITYVPEQVFRSKSVTKNSEVGQEISKEINVQADASVLVIDGKPVAFVENEEKAKEVLKQIKLKYVSEEELNVLETQQTADNAALPQLKENESRILDVRLSKEVSVSKEKVLPDQIMPVEDVVKLLEKGSLEEVKYKVKNGDVLGGIAHAHNLKLNELLSINPGLTEDSVLQIDQELNVTILKPFVQVIIDKEYFTKEAIPFENEVEEDSSMPKGDTKVKQEGKDGIRAATYRISEQNGKVIAKDLTKEEVIQEPVKHIVIKGTKVIPSRGDGNFAWPTVGGYVSSHVGYRWGRMHKGIDIARPSNRTIKAADNGVVVSAGYDGGFGNKIVINHQNGFQTVYGHLASIEVSVGQVVSKGTKIGVMGSTGDSTGVHLHFEIHKNGNIENPLKYIR
ncbi:peptidoglycan DD-metalloendopeptidase family protein [Bacillus sp. Bva_UNVM-123]|uniref:peptidoglycan DD-metalloendopeptidase family protein n=1 Tax=Bacillus sp. Bva_UNVM-123 TaxID=2829798 RepID=UPI00391F34A2